MRPAAKRAAYGAAAILAIAAVVMLPAPVHAATRLPQVCTDPSSAGKAVNAACGGYQQTGQIYRTPLPSDLVRVMTNGATSADWDSAAYQWARWQDVETGRLYDSCLDDIPENSPVVDGPCRNWGMVPKLGPTGTFTATPTTGTAPLSTVVTWDVANGTNCQAGGAWSGTKAAKGSETITISKIGADTLTLACSVPGPNGPGKAVLTWTKPTQNTDGTALTDLAGFNLYSGRTNPPTTKLSPMLGPNVTTYTFANLLPADVEWFFGIEAVNTPGATSTPLAVASKVIAGTPTVQPWAATPIPINVTAPVQKIPRAPVLSVQ